MDNVITISAILLACFAGYFLLSVAAAWLVPVEKSSRMLFDQELKKHGIDQRLIPESFRQEAVDIALASAVSSGESSRSAAYKARVVRSIEFEVEMLHLYFSIPEQFASFDTDHSLQMRYRKHGIPKP